MLLTIAALLSTWIILFCLESRPVELAPLILWMLIGIMGESYSVFLDKGNIHLSPMDAVLFGSYLTGGPVPTLVTICAIYLLKFRRVGKNVGGLFKSPFRLTLFNITHYIVILLGVHGFYLLLTALTNGKTLFSALCSSPLFFLSSCLLNALFYKLEEGRDFTLYLKEMFLPHSINALAAGFASVIIALTYPRYGVFSLFFFVVPAFVTRLLYIEKAESP